MRAVASKCCNLLIYLYFILLLHYAPSQGELKSLLLDNLNTDPKWNGLEAALIVDEPNETEAMRVGGEPQ